jgi:hypothetical protein
MTRHTQTKPDKIQIKRYLFWRETKFTPKSVVFVKNQLSKKENKTPARAARPQNVFQN